MLKQTFNFKVVKLDGPDFLKADSVFNYDKLNKDIDKIIEENKTITLTTTTYGTGILIYGLNLPSKLLKFQIDIHLHFALSGNLFLKTNSSSTLEEYNNLRNLLVDNKIHKYFNIKSNRSIEINNSVFDKIIDYLEFKVYDKDYKLYSTKAIKENKLETISKPKQISTDDSKQKFTDDETDIILIDSALSDAENNDERIKIYKTFFDENFKIDKPVGMIVHSHLLEHIIDVNKFLSCCYSNLEEDGLMILSIPNFKQYIKNNKATTKKTKKIQKNEKC
jgi:hypothetical protein